MDVINKIISTLKEKGYTQVDLAKALKEKGVNKQTITDWKSGKSNTYYSLIAEIADFLKVSADYLLNRTDQPSAVNKNNEKGYFTMTFTEEEKRTLKEAAELNKLMKERSEEKSPPSANISVLTSIESSLLDILKRFDTETKKHRFIAEVSSLADKMLEAENISDIGDLTVQSVTEIKKSGIPS